MLGRPIRTPSSGWKPKLRVSTEAGQPQDKEAILFALAVVVRAYLRGEGRVDRKRGLICSHPVLKIAVDNREWELGRQSSRPHYPD